MTETRIVTLEVARRLLREVARRLLREVARRLLREAVHEAGGPAEFAQRDFRLTERQLSAWVKPDGGMPSAAAFKAAKIKPVTMFEVPE